MMEGVEGTFVYIYLHIYIHVCGGILFSVVAVSHIIS